MHTARITAAVLALAGAAAGQVPEGLKTKPPASDAKVSLDDHPFKPGEKVTRTRYSKDKAGKPTKTTEEVIAPEEKWLTGIDGAESPEGFYVLGVRTVARPDGTMVAPAENVTVRVKSKARRAKLGLFCFRMTP